MRYAVLGLALLVLGSCGDPVAEHIDEVRRSGRPLLHVESELRTAGPAVSSLGKRLGEDPDARAILDARASAVPALERLLSDDERRALAAAFLAEIGGDKAAAALLDCWRSARDDAQEKTIYRIVGDERIRIGYRYEGTDHAFYGELMMALAYAGRPVAAEIATDTRAAIEESERLHAAGVELVVREEREEEGRRIELRHRAPSVDTAREGLRLLAMLRAPEAPSLLVKALRSPILPLRITAVQQVVYLTQPTDEVLRALHPLLDDPELRLDAAEQVEFLLDPTAAVDAEPARRLPQEKQAALVARCKERLALRLR